MAKTIIVIPTYNERENIQLLLKEIFLNNPEVEILFVDDNSPDGTADLIEKIIIDDKRIHLLRRSKKEGIARAYIDGFKKALAMNPDYIIQMDADLSHAPKYINDMLREARAYDMVIGSRFIKGGGVSDRNLFRVIISHVAGFVCGLIVGIGISDPLGGFKCFKTKTLKGLDFEKIQSRGYFFQLEMNYMVTKAGFSHKEMPITFVERKRGSSKLSFDIACEAFFSVWKLRLR